jgi:hypothetical protein
LSGYAVSQMDCTEVPAWGIRQDEPMLSWDEEEAEEEDEEEEAAAAAAGAAAWASTVDAMGAGLRVTRAGGRDVC